MRTGFSIALAVVAAVSAAVWASHALPFEVFLLAMLLEEHKEVLRLRRLFETAQPL